VTKTALGLALGALGVALALAGGASALSEATKIQVSASLDAAREVPKPTGSLRAARGSFTATVTRSGSGGTLAWRLSFSGLSGSADAAHVHVAPRGTAGPVAVPLCGPCSSRASGRATVDRAFLTALASGRTYVNVHTAANAAGEIRGQVGTVAKVRTALSAAQEVPRPTGSVARARGLFTATITKTGPTATATWKLTFSRLTGAAAAAHIHVGARGKAGPVAVALCGPCRNGVTGRAVIRGSTLRALEAGRAYVNVHTAANPGGEVRGQIAAVPLTISG
jgi:hypothetical protein